jgi:hypothetical protein
MLEALFGLSTSAEALHPLIAALKRPSTAMTNKARFM